jgi:excisionase family DNA binding protein
MGMNNMLTLEEVKNFLEVEPEEIERLVKEGKLHAYKIGGVYLRFRKEEVMNLRFEILPKKVKSTNDISFLSRAGDFWRFNNFYILSLLLILFLFFLIAQF